MQTQYLQYLHAAFNQRSYSNPNYSLRAFARDLKISPSALHKILNGHGGMSALKATHIAKQIGLNGYDKQVFLLSVEGRHARSEKKRLAAAHKLHHLFQNIINFAPLDLDKFKFMSHWYHLAILEMAHLKDFIPEAKWIAAKLGLTVEDVQEAMELLIRLKLASNRNSKFHVELLHTETPADIPSAAIRAFHESMLRLAEQKMKDVDVQNREYRTMVIAVNSQDIDEMKTMIREFQQKFFKRFERTGHKDKVYTIAMQLFPLMS